MRVGVTWRGKLAGRRRARLAVGRRGRRAGSRGRGAGLKIGDEVACATRRTEGTRAGVPRARIGRTTGVPEANGRRRARRGRPAVLETLALAAQHVLVPGTAVERGARGAAGEKRGTRRGLAPLLHDAELGAREVQRHGRHDALPARQRLLRGVKLVVERAIDLLGVAERVVVLVRPALLGVRSRRDGRRAPASVGGRIHVVVVCMLDFRVHESGSCRGPLRVGLRKTRE